MKARRVAVCAAAAGGPPSVLRTALVQARRLRDTRQPRQPRATPTGSPHAGGPADGLSHGPCPTPAFPVTPAHTAPRANVGPPLLTAARPAQRRPRPCARPGQRAAGSAVHSSRQLLTGYPRGPAPLAVPALGAAGDGKQGPGQAPAPLRPQQRDSQGPKGGNTPVSVCGRRRDTMCPSTHQNVIRPSLREEG